MIVLGLIYYIIGCYFALMPAARAKRTYRFILYSTAAVLLMLVGLAMMTGTLVLG